MAKERPQIVIAGAGFGGLWTARRLAGAPVDVTLIDRNNFHTFFPLLYQIGAAELEAVEIAYPVRGILRRHKGVRFRMAEVTGVDLEARSVHTSAGSLTYDGLVVAIGSSPHFFGVEGAADSAFPLRTLEHGLALRNHILHRFERAARAPAATNARGRLRFVIVGGGPTGVEFAGALAELVFGPLSRDYRDVADRIGVELIEARDRLLPEMPEKLGRYAERRLARIGVRVRTGTRVARVTPAAVVLTTGETLGTETVVWTAGMQGEPAAARWGLPTTAQGRVSVLPTLQLEEHPEVFVVGDLADPQTKAGSPPMVAPVAIDQAETAADNLLRVLRGEAPRTWRFRDRGMLATIGRNAGVAHLWGRCFTGFPAWLLWLGVHLVKLIGFRNRLVVLVNWAWDYFFFERAVRLILPLREAARLELERGERLELERGEPLELEGDDRPALDPGQQ